MRVDIAGGPITYFSVEAADMTLEQLSWFVDNTVAKELLSIPGMAQVSRSGGVDREIRVILDPARKIGRASGRERVCQYVYISVVAVSLKKKKEKRVDSNE